MRNCANTETWHKVWCPAAMIRCRYSNSSWKLFVLRYVMVTAACLLNTLSSTRLKGTGRTATARTPCDITALFMIEKTFLASFSLTESGDWRVCEQGGRTCAFCKSIKYIYDILHKAYDTWQVSLISSYSPPSRLTTSSPFQDYHTDTICMFLGFLADN